MKRVEPGPNQESVWDYPRPPRLEPCTARLQVVFGGETIVDTTRSHRVLETSHPPTYYIPAEDVQPGVLQSNERMSMCEWKGLANYFDVRVGHALAPEAAWCYHAPTKAFAPIKSAVAFYAHLMDDCFVDGEKVQAQEGDFYGGWVTSKVVGPFKGAPGTLGW